MNFAAFCYRIRHHRLGDSMTDHDLTQCPRRESNPQAALAAEDFESNRASNGDNNLARRRSHDECRTYHGIAGHTHDSTTERATDSLQSSDSFRRAAASSDALSDSPWARLAANPSLRWFLVRSGT